MKIKEVTIGLLTKLLLLAPFICTTVQGQLIKLAESGDQEPDGTNVFLLIAPFPTLNEAGQVAFNSDLRNNGFLQGYGIYLADGSTVKTIARESEPAPDLNGNFYSFYNLVALNGTSQAFEVNLRGTLEGGTDNSAFYQLNAGTLNLIARAGQRTPDGGTFKSFETVSIRMNRSGQTAFTGSTSTSPFVMYRSTGTNLTRLAFWQEPLPDGSGTLSGADAPALNNNGQVAFYSSTLSTNLSGYFLADDRGLITLAKGYQTVPDGNGYFLFFRFNVPGLNDSGQIAFVADLRGTSGGAADDQGLYRSDGSTIAQLARKGQLVPGGNGRFLDFGQKGNAPINNAGVVAFSATLTGTTGGNSDNSGIFLADTNGVRQVARAGQTAPDGNGRFSGFGYPALNNNGQIAFSATLIGTAGGTTDNQGLFLTDASLRIQQIVRSGLVINGETLSNPEFLTGPNFGGLSGLNDNGQLAFSAGLNGNAAVFLWGTPSSIRTQPKIISIQPVADSIRLEWQGEGGSTNYVEAAVTLAGPFTNIDTVVLPAGTQVTTNFVDTSLTTNLTRFYRIREL